MLPITTLAQERVPSAMYQNLGQTEKEYLKQFEKELQGKSIDELNAIIRQLEAESYQRSVGDIAREWAKKAWLAFASSVEQLGYTSAAKLIRASVYGENYYEINGSIARAIRKTDVYKDLIRCPQSTTWRFPDGDLYYAIHKFGVDVDLSKRVTIFDTFDFEATKRYSSIGSFFNQLGYLSQNADVLQPIKVTIVVPYE